MQFTYRLIVHQFLVQEKMDEKYMETILEKFTKTDLFKIILGLSREIQEIKMELFELEDEIRNLKGMN